jgi:hypothetical protein
VQWGFPRKELKAMKRRLVISVVLASATLGVPAFAADYAPPLAPDETGKVQNAPSFTAQRGNTVAEFFARYDVNRDGVVSWSEAQADADLVQVFARADANRDGALTAPEFNQAANLAHRRG